MFIDDLAKMVVVIVGVFPSVANHIVLAWFEFRTKSSFGIFVEWVRRHVNVLGGGY